MRSLKKSSLATGKHSASCAALLVSSLLFTPFARAESIESGQKVNSLLVPEAPQYDTSSELPPVERKVLSEPGLDPSAKAPEKSMPSAQALISALSGPGWEALPLVTLSAVGSAMVTSEGKSVSDVGGQPANILLEYGCTDAASRSFRRGNRQCSVNSFCFATAAGAFGAYSVMRRGASTVVIRGDASSEDDNSISFWKGNRFFFLTVDNQDDEASELITKFADSIVAKLAGTFKGPYILRLLPNWEKIPGSEKVFMGPQSLRRYFNIPYSSSLMVDGCQMAGGADYAISEYRERLKLLVVDCGNPGLAQSVFKAYSSNMSLSCDRVERGSSMLIARISGSYIMCQQVGTLVSVISGARKKNALYAVARMLVN